MSEFKRNELGRVAFRIQGDWWVAYYAKPDTMEGALELGRIQIAIVQDLIRRDAFMLIMNQYISELMPEFAQFEIIPGPEHERSGSA